MNKSEAIRTLGREGHSVAEIVRRVGVRYQFAHNVLRAAGLLEKKPRAGLIRKFSLPWNIRGVRR